MSESDTAANESGKVSLWAVLAAPALWALHLNLTYMLVPFLCGTRKVYILHVITAISLILTAAAGMLAFREWRSLQRQPPAVAVPARDSSRFLSILGMMVSALFFIVIFASGLPGFFFDPCIQ